jgi:hypothetical protein
MPVLELQPENNETHFLFFFNTARRNLFVSSPNEIAPEQPYSDGGHVDYEAR